MLRLADAMLEVTLATFCDHVRSEGFEYGCIFFLLVPPMRCPYVHPSSLPVLRTDMQLPGASDQKVGWYTQSGRRAGVLAVRRRYQLLGVLTAMIEYHLFRPLAVLSGKRISVGVRE